MIIVTGAAGFIGSNLLEGLNQKGYENIIAVDDLTEGEKYLNMVDAKISDYIDLNTFYRTLEADIHGKTYGRIRAILHQGACSDTTERNGAFMMERNYECSKTLFHYAQTHGIPFIYASSAAVYGANQTFEVDPAYEKPLNVYGYSKILFDRYVRNHWQQLTAQVVGLRYFNVYGPREQHKGRMASVAYHNSLQFRKEGHVRLFKGTDGYADGGQLRDFISVEDVVKVNLHFLSRPELSGIYNCGTGSAQSFNEVAAAVVNYFLKTNHSVAELVEQGYIRYIDFPTDLIGRYQSYTQAEMSPLLETRYNDEFLTVQQGVTKYMQWLYD